MRHAVARLYLLSACREERSPDDNRVMTDALREALREGHDFFPVRGRETGGPVEEGFMVFGAPVDNYLEREAIRALAERFDQQTFLERHPDGAVEAHSVARPEDSEWLGTWQAGEPKGDEGYTEHSGQRWVIR